MTRPLCLLVDDDAIATCFVADLLAGHGYQVIHAASISEANRLLIDHCCAFILVDKRLPDGDGLAWLQSTLSARANLQAHCILITGDLVSSVDLPAGVHYLRKPIDATQLLSWLGSNRLAASDPELDRGSHVEVLENDGALRRMGGRLESLLVLRDMLRAELASGRAWHLALADDSSRRQSLAQLHRLTAACALTGCVQLGQQAAQVEAKLKNGQPLTATQLSNFLRSVSETLAALAR